MFAVLFAVSPSELGSSSVTANKSGLVTSPVVEAGFGGVPPNGNKETPTAAPFVLGDGLPAILPKLVLKFQKGNMWIWPNSGRT